MLAKPFTQFLEQQLDTRIQNISPVSGGSINAVYCLQTDKGKYLLKVNNKAKFPGMFACEANGLKVIADSKTIAVPGIISQGDFEGQSFLLLEWINSRRPTAHGAALLGRETALMHRNTAQSFGLSADNYMGSLHQSNTRHNMWADFFIAERLQPMVALAADKQLLGPKDVQHFETLYKNLPGLFDEEAPALIHGDLWGGNYLIGEDETPYLIDPAISYGHREFDIAMTMLFGGFADEFYQAYQEEFPLAKGWEGRMDLWNLYPLLVHLNLFGSGYLGQLRGCLGQFV